MPAAAQSSGDEQWQRARKLAATHGRADDSAYGMACLKKSAEPNPDFDRQYHTQSGHDLPLPPDDIDEVHVEELGKRLAKQCRGWSMQDHQDAASSHMLAGIEARGDAVGWSSYDAEPKLHLARQHIRMSQAHNIASGHVQKRSGSPNSAAGSIRKALKGAGTKGGSVISYTRSGKAVYAPGHGHQIGYTHEDHHDAAKAHVEAARKLTEAKKRAKTANAVGRLRTQAVKHIELAQAHLDAQEAAKPAPEPAAPPPAPEPIPEPPAAVETKQDAPQAKSKRPVKYIKREKGPDGKWVYTYADDKKPAKPRKKKKAAVEAKKDAPAPSPKVLQEYKGYTLMAGKNGLVDVFSGTYLRMTSASLESARKFVDGLTVDPPSADNPDREEAEEELAQEKAEGEYAYARESKFSNKGEDLQLSARHKINAWRGLEDAEKKGIAAELVKRDMLMKIKPLDYFKTIESGHPLVALTTYLAMKKFPAQPTHRNVTKLVGKRSDDEALAHVWQNDKGWEKLAYIRYGEGSPAAGYDKKVATLSKTQLEARNRAEYMQAFERLNEEAQFNLSAGRDDNWGLEGMRNAAIDIMKRLRGIDMYSDTANQMIRMINTGMRTGGYRAKANSIQADLNQVNEYLTQIPVEQRGPALMEATKQIVSGKSIAQAFGKVSEKTGTKVEKPKEFTSADAYVAHATRKGPDYPGTTTKDEQEKTLLGAMGLRGLQWGNSVTDDERSHHLKQSALAFDDLVDVLGLPKKMVSFNDRLGLSIGARGHGTAMAHYEPTMRIINLTRKNGVGSLAHEWGHFFDNICSELVQAKKSEFLTDKARNNTFYDGEKRSDNPVTAAMEDLFSSAPMKAFKQRLEHEMDTKYKDRISYKRRAYWRSTIEVWARCFERHVQTKMEGMGRENTYLSGGTNRDLWPNDEESKAMQPYFDKVFEAFRNSDLLHKAMAMAAVHGEGSHGGVVIGRTASGKPVYRHGAKSAANFTAQDHAEAARVHANHATISAGEAKRHHEYMARYHEFRATGRTAPDAVRQGQMSKGLFVNRRGLVSCKQGETHG